jgi:2-polyprenyl-6-hydroxyphenyl methylase / 3-demethylubiquinone-9 3-methyltransferase
MKTPRFFSSAGASSYSILPKRGNPASGVKPVLPKDIFMAAKKAPSPSGKNDTGTASAEDVAQFTAMAETWWDADGPFRPLHAINPLRIAFIKDAIVEHFAKDPALERPLEGLELLDIGCGGGLLSEPMCRLGAETSSIDAGDKNIQIAKIHAEQSRLKINYRNILPEDLSKEGALFDVVLNMEVIEHVADTHAFMQACCAMVRPGGVMVLSTLNRTLKSLALAKIGAEYVLRWLPRGTHDWRKFLKPSETASLLRENGLDITQIKGMTYNPFSDEWSLGSDLDINYLALAIKHQNGPAD